MSNFTFRPSARENVHVLGGFIGGTGSGKTYSALRVAKGLAGDRKFAVIDTEARRALHYADMFSFDHGDLKPPFTPDAYLDAILAAEKAGYPVCVVDSMSHEHAGEGGILDWHEAELNRMAGDDFGKREKVKFTAWIKPKASHKKMLTKLLQLRMHLILCFRAEPKVKIQKVKQGDREKTEVVDAGWLPICAKGLEFELTFSFLLSHEHPGIYLASDAPGYGRALKLPEVLKPSFPEGKPIDEACGQALAVWAAGGAAGGASGASSRPAMDQVELITESQLADLEALIQEHGAKVEKILAWKRIAKLEHILAAEFKEVCDQVRAVSQRRKAGTPA